MFLGAVIYKYKALVWQCFCVSSISLKKTQGTTGSMLNLHTLSLLLPVLKRLLVSAGTESLESPDNSKSTVRTMPTKT